MTPRRLWLVKWQGAIDFLETNLRKFSKFVRRMGICVLFVEHSKKLHNSGELNPSRVRMFKQVLELGAKYWRVNQYK